MFRIARTNPNCSKRDHAIDFKLIIINHGAEISDAFGYNIIREIAPSD